MLRVHTVKSNSGICSKISSHRAKQQGHWSNFLTVYIYCMQLLKVTTIQVHNSYSIKKVCFNWKQKILYCVECRCIYCLSLFVCGNCKGEQLRPAGEYPNHVKYFLKINNFEQQTQQGDLHFTILNNKPNRGIYTLQY